VITFPSDTEVNVEGATIEDEDKGRFLILVSVTEFIQTSIPGSSDTFTAIHVSF